MVTPRANAATVVKDKAQAGINSKTKQPKVAKPKSEMPVKSATLGFPSRRVWPD
ncbi:MAG: hypothetical protein COB94_000045 [Gammaproteobacteria bacterium]|nr:hypothetical protein [Gammaproteobacteria bacterium]